MIQRALQRLLDGHDLTRGEARAVMGAIMRGEATQAQIGGFLVALRAKGETSDEIAGVQFHPESVLTPDGPALARNFLEGRL